jgi:MOSC domain-containing protein
MIVGRIAEIWRYPVKSMGGERIRETSLGANGLPGDRAWAVRDEVRGGIRGAKKIPALMRCSARYTSAPSADRVPAPEIGLPGGDTLRADAPDANARVSAAVGTQVTLWPLRPASDVEHYKRGAPDSTDVLTELRSIFGREEGEPLPDLSVFPPDLFQYESPPGTYFDAFPLLLLTGASLRRLAQLAPSSRVDVRRFRPNLLIETEGGDAGFPELAWAGKRLRVGDAELSVGVACPRCVMITHGFDDLPKDPGLMRTLVREAGGSIGVYASVAEPGAVRVGDSVEPA